MQDEDLKKGSVLLEAHYVFDCPAPQSLAVEQYFGDDLLRVVLSEDCEDLSTQLSHDYLNEAFRSIKKPLAKQVVTVKRPALQQQLTTAETIASDAVEAIKQQALANAEATIGAQLQRLESLAQRNQSVREDEIQAVKDKLAETTRALMQLRCVLDSVRVFGIA
jgi:ATP-dependent helicase HepA